MANARKEKEDAVRWCSEQLSSMLGFGNPDAAQEMALYIWGLETESDMKAYMADLLGPENRFSDRFVRDLYSRKKEISAKTAPPPGARVYKKSDMDDFQFMTGKSSKKAAAASAAQPAATAVASVPAASTQAQVQAQASPSPSSAKAEALGTPTFRDVEEDGSGSGKKSKPKYVNFLSLDGQGRLAAMVPGRKQCDCMASKHSLINNCLTCGRIVCSQEGPGPCYCCSSIVVSPQDQELLQRDSKQSRKTFEKMLKDWGLESYVDKERLLQSALPDKTNASLAESLALAESRKNKLVYYDRNATQRTKVIDDEADYFTTDGNKWLTEDQKQALKDKENAIREKKKQDSKKQTITLDFAGRRVIEDEYAPDESTNLYNPSVAEETLKALQQRNAEPTAPVKVNKSAMEGGLSNNPFLAKNAIHPHFIAPKPTLEDKMKDLSLKTTTSSSSSTTTTTSSAPASSDLTPAPAPERTHQRIQDRELNEMSDEGMCMALHQPYSGLLARGVMIHEGRVWYTPHRGRLYISSATKEPTAEEIKELEEYYGSANPGAYNYPKDYPLGCLLGYVDVVDCLPQEEYRKRFPDGLSHSPFVFICENPHELLIKYPIKNQHKIFKLDKEMHQNAKKMARSSKTFL